jgi:hypothetical protein
MGALLPRCSGWLAVVQGRKPEVLAESVFEPGLALPVDSTGLRTRGRPAQMTSGTVG